MFEDTIITIVLTILKLALLTFLTVLAFLVVVATYNGGARAVAFFLGGFLFVLLAALSGRALPRRK